MEYLNLCLFLTFIVGVFYIILLIKIWKMTNNVADIKNKYMRTYSKRSDVKKVVINPFYTKEEKGKILYDNIYHELYEIYYNKEMSNRYEEFQDIMTFYTKLFNEVNIDDKILTLKNIDIDFKEYIN